MGHHPEVDAQYRPRRIEGAGSARHAAGAAAEQVTPSVTNGHLHFDHCGRPAIRSAGARHGSTSPERDPGRGTQHRGLHADCTVAAGRYERLDGEAGVPARGLTSSPRPATPTVTSRGSSGAADRARHRSRAEPRAPRPRTAPTCSPGGQGETATEQTTSRSAGGLSPSTWLLEFHAKLVLARPRPLGQDAPAPRVDQAAGSGRSRAGRPAGAWRSACAVKAAVSASAVVRRARPYARVVEERAGRDGEQDIGDVSVREVLRAQPIDVETERRSRGIRSRPRSANS